MTMRANTDPRRVYTRAGIPLVCFGGIYFGLGKGETKIDTDREVKLEVLSPAGGRKRIEVKQKQGGKTVTETWTEQHIKFGTRAKKSTKRASVASA